MIQPLALLALLALGQDDRVELKWAAAPEDRFDVKWTYDEVHTRVAGTGEKFDLTDKRAVEAEMAPADQPGRFAIALKKVSWTYGTHEFEIVLAWAAGPKPPAATVKMKVDPKAASAAAAKAASEARSEQMKKLVAEGAYVLTYDENSREAYVTRNGSAARNASVFDLLFLHGPLPKGTVANGEAWKEELGRVTFPQLVEVKTMPCKVAVAGPGVSVKGGFTQPISRSGGAKGEVTTGTFSFAREYAFAKEGGFLSSKEEQSFTKKVDAKGADADFYKENSTHTIKQAATFKKRAAAKPPEAKK
jgi:hypothetical protein